MDFDKEMEKKFDDLFWYVLNEQTQQLNKEKEYMELNRTCQEITGTNSKIQAIIENYKESKRGWFEIFGFEKARRRKRIENL